MTRIAGISPEVARELLAFYRQAKAAGLLSGPGRGQLPQLPQAVPIYVRNVSGEAIPAYACMQATGTVESGGQNYIQVDKPADATGAAGGFLFNGPREIEVGGNGIGHAGPVAKALGDGSAVAAGDKWSPAASAWTITPTSGGLFAVIGGDDVASNVVRVFVGASDGVVHAKTPIGGIPAISTLTMGSASCDIYECSSAGVLSDSGTNETIYNMASSAVAAETHIIAARNSAGLLVVIVEDCG